LYFDKNSPANRTKRWRVLVIFLESEECNEDLKNAAVRGGNFAHGNVFVHGRGFVGPVHFFHPYYAFHPRVRIGFGLWGGYPFAYPYTFYYPYYPSYYYPYVPSYPYAPNGYVSSDANATSGTSGSLAQPSETNLGGLSFEITPSNAELFVDNMRVGTVGDFTPTTQPLGVEAGHHHVEIRAPGYQTMSLDVDIIAGQVIPYQGSLEQ
jgi:PEGA domain